MREVPVAQLGVDHFQQVKARGRAPQRGHLGRTLRVLRSIERRMIWLDGA